MLLVDSNVFVYARGRHERSESCRAILAAAARHPEWVVPGIVLLELTHYYADAGAYARAILRAFPPVETRIADLEWAAAHAPAHPEFNDHVILAGAHRLGATGIVGYDGFFDRQEHHPTVCGVRPEDLLREPG
jgi:predicted nucleic acid-binding protein